MHSAQHPHPPVGCVRRTHIRIECSELGGGSAKSGQFVGFFLQEQKLRRPASTPLLPPGAFPGPPVLQTRPFASHPLLPSHSVPRVRSPGKPPHPPTHSRRPPPTQGPLGVLKALTETHTVLPTLPSPFDLGPFPLSFPGGHPFDAHATSLGASIIENRGGSGRTYVFEFLSQQSARRHTFAASHETFFF